MRTSSPVDQLFANQWLWAAVALSVGPQIAVVHFGFLNDAFDTAPLSAGDWLLTVGLSSVVLWVGELYKFVARRADRRRDRD